MIDEKTRVIMEFGLINQEQIQFCLEEQLITSKPMIDIILNKGFISEEKLKEVIELYKLKDLNIYKLNVSPDVLNMLPPNIIKLNRVFPLLFENNKFVVGMLDPNDLIIKDTISILLGRNIQIQGFKISQKDFNFLIGKYEYLLVDKKDKEVEQIRESANKSGVELPVNFEKLVTNTLENAVKKQASLITIEPYEHDVRIRFRIDNIFYEESRFPKKIYQNFLAYLKELSSLEGEEKNFYYSGNFSYTTFDKQELSFVINGLKTTNGDKLVLRPSYRIPDLQQLFYCPEPYEYVSAITNKNKGLILVIGGAGSGKTTTLYSILQNKISNRYQLMTIEDPVEYVFENYVSQIQIKNDRINDLENVINEISRHNPDVLMVHDIRDENWAFLLEELALSGMLVMAGMRAYNTYSALKRLKRLKFPNFSSIQCIINQKLVKKPCFYCRIKYKPSLAELNNIGLGQNDDKNLQFYMADPKGCEKCLGGYKGMIGLFEVVKMSRELVYMLNNSNSFTEDLGKTINSSCVITFKEYGLRLLKDGVITIEEFLKIT